MCLSNSLISTEKGRGGRGFERVIAEVLVVIWAQKFCNKEATPLINGSAIWVHILRYDLSILSSSYSMAV